MARALRWAVLVGLVLPAAGVAQKVGPTRTATVTYLGRGWLFVDAGSAEGLREGSQVEIVRRGRTVAVLRVESVDVHQANCAVVSRQVSPAVGDSVRFTPIASPATRLPVVAARPPAPPRPPAPAAPSAESTVAATMTRQQVAPPPSDSTQTLRFVSPESVIRPPLIERPVLDATASRQGGTATVTYMSGDWLLVDAGSAEGLLRGSEVEVTRRGRTVALLRVESLVDHQANCAVVSRQLPLTVGDSVRFTPIEPPTKTSPLMTAQAPSPQVAPPSRAATPVAPPERASVRAIPAVRSAAAPVAAATSVVQQPLVVATTLRPGITNVTFVSGAEIYVGAGRREGLLDGAELYVVRRDSVVSTLRVKFLSSHQASCEVTQGVSDLVVGDVVRFVPSLSLPGTGTAAFADRPRRPRRLSGPGIHGRLGMRHLRATSGVTDSSGVPSGRTAFNQPSFDLRLAGLSIGGTPMGLAVDLRTRRTATTSTGQANSVDGRTRVYQMAVFWGAPGAPLRTVAGRQYLAAVTSVGMFDGGLVEVNRSLVTLGAFGGLEPDAANLGFSRAIQDHGAYVQVHNRPGTPSSWFLTTGAVRSFQAGSANREFGFMQASASSSRFSFYGLQEVDYYPSWKVQLGEKQFSFTSQYASGLYRPSHWLSFNGTYDNRRSVRLYRDTQNPETSFDDAYRQGFGGGVQLTGRKAYIGGDWRRSTGGTAGAADSYTGTLGLDRFTRLKLGFSARATWYQNQNDSASMRTRGQLYAGRLGFDPVGLLHVDFNGGMRREHNPSSAVMQRSTWFGVDMDASVARSWFVSFSGLRQKDPANPGTITTTQMYASLTWRF